MHEERRTCPTEDAERREIYQRVLGQGGQPRGTCEEGRGTADEASRALTAVQATWFNRWKKTYDPR